MAVNQQPLSRTITLPTTQVSAGNGLSQLSNATSQVSQLVTERLNDIAINQASTQGELDVEAGRQPEKLALPFTKATRAYNQAVTNTESNRMIASAESLINESLINNKNPATFTRETPAKFHAELEGIKSGILENARDENREHIRASLDRLTAHASLNMLQHSIEFDNKQAKFDMQQDVQRLLEDRRNAAVAGDMDRIAGIDAQLEQTIGDYSTMNAEIARIAPYLKKDIETHKQVDNALHGYATALADGNEAFYLKDLAENKENLPYSVWQDAVKGVVALDQEHKRLSNDFNAIQWSQVQLGIEDGSIQNPADILNYDITVPQKLTAIKQLDVAQAKQMAQGSELITAQQNILSGRPEFNTGSTRDKMFKTQIKNLEKQEGRPATLVDMSQSVLGQNAYPASGMPQTPIGTSVPAFDSVMQGKLSGGDIQATAQAAMVYNDMVNVQGKPNSINLTGDSLAVANLFNELNQGGTTPEQAAEQAINTVLHAKEPEVALRVDRFNRTLAKVNPSDGSNQLQSKFKQAFGLAPQAFGSDEAFRLFQDTYRSNYISSNSEEAAFNATKYAMRAWGTSKYFDKGFVGQPVPEKELPITKVGNAFGNQIVANVQGFINRNNAAREKHPELNIPVVEWADSKQTITGSETEQDKVFKNFTIGNHPRIKINGHESDVVLIPSASSRLGSGVNYLLGVYDQFNNLNPLQDVTNTVDHVARFSPKELSIWAPGIASKKTDEDLRSVALKVQQKEVRSGDNELKNLEKKTPAWAVILGLASPNEYLQHIATRNADTDEGRINQIIDSLKGKSESAGSAETRNSITDAGNVGISQDLTPVIPGNIDLDTRPRVKNPDGKVSTVRSIGVQADGLEFVIPTVSDDGKLLSDKEAIALFRKTKKHLGAFKTVKQANDFAEALHQSEAAKLSKGNLND